MSEKSSEMPNGLQSKITRIFFDKMIELTKRHEPDEFWLTRQLWFEGGARECWQMMIERETKLKAQLEKAIAALKAVNKVGLSHYEDCQTTIADDENCDCGVEAVEYQVWKVIEKASE